MELNDDNLIDQYLNNSLSESDRLTFEARLQNDASLQEELNIRKDMNRFLKKRSNKKELKATLDNVGADFFKIEQEEIIEKIPVQSSGMRSLWIAVSGLAAAAVLILYLLSPWQKSLYDNFATHPSLSLTEKSTTVNQTATQAETSFNQQKYQEALNALNTYLETNSNDTQAQLYKGICHLELAQYPQANTLFEQISKGPTAFKDDAQWYLVMTALKQNNIALVKTQLNKISPQSDWHDEAQSLLQKIK